MDKEKNLTAYLKRCMGFSLVEVLVVLALMGLLAIFLGSRLSNTGEDWKYYKTCHIMEEIKEALIGRPSLYCNGIRQFTGYVSDMGNLPELIDGQPKGLWRRGIKNIPDNKEDELPEWKYYDGANIWAGWKGPYIKPPPDDVLKDAWGNPFIFIIGELVTYNEKTCCCIRTHDCTAVSPHEPGNEQYWKELTQLNGSFINANPWFDPNMVLQEEGKMVDTFFEDALVIVSYGKDGRPGGKGLNKDLVITIYREEWTGEVSGHVGYRGNPYVTKVTLYCPKKGEIESAPIEIVDNDHRFDMDGEIIYYGINFRFGTAPLANGAVDPNWRQVAVPVGIRSIKAGGKTCIFPVEAAGNWIGTFK